MYINVTNDLTSRCSKKKIPILIIITYIVIGANASATTSITCASPVRRVNNNIFFLFTQLKPCPSNGRYGGVVVGRRKVCRNRTERTWPRGTSDACNILMCCCRRRRRRRIIVYLP